jgi:protein-disulfide isomerase
MGWRRAATVLLLALVVACDRPIDGTALAPAGLDPQAEVRITDDGFGIRLGKPSAHAAIEIYIEPQCSHCAKLEMLKGDEIQDYIGRGDLQVTYRPVTFFDMTSDGTSHRVSNTFFLAAARDMHVTAVQLQNYVQEWYWQAMAGADDGYIGQVAQDARLPQSLVDRITAGAAALDTTAMDAANRARLSELCHCAAAPTGYDLNAERLVDLTDDDWLKNLVESR